MLCFTVSTVVEHGCIWCMIRPCIPHFSMVGLSLFQGAAFGFSTIAATAREELSPHLPLLVPRLYRYKYDPNPRIQLAMTSIWSAVVPESKKAVSLRYLCYSCTMAAHGLRGMREWRRYIDHEGGARVGL